MFPSCTIFHCKTIATRLEICLVLQHVNCCIILMLSQRAIRYTGDYCLHSNKLTKQQLEILLHPVNLVIYPKV